MSSIKRREKEQITRGSSVVCRDVPSKVETPNSTNNTKNITQFKIINYTI